MYRVRMICHDYKDGKPVTYEDKPTKSEYPTFGDAWAAVKKMAQDEVDCLNAGCFTERAFVHSEGDKIITVDCYYDADGVAYPEGVETEVTRYIIEGVQ